MISTIPVRYWATRTDNNCKKCNLSLDKVVAIARSIRGAVADHFHQECMRNEDIVNENDVRELDKKSGALRKAGVMDYRSLRL